jgi:hypothetical protein
MEELHSDERAQGRGEKERRRETAPKQIKNQTSKQSSNWQISELFFFCPGSGEWPRFQFRQDPRVWIRFGDKTGPNLSL